MKFTLSTSKIFYAKEETPLMEELGFTFKEAEYYPGSIYFLINSDDKNPSIEIRSIEELMEFNHKFGKLIINGDSIEIYNDYRE